MMLARAEHDTEVSDFLSSHSGPEDLYHLCGSMEQAENASDERNTLTQYLTYLEQSSILSSIRRHTNNTLNRRHR